MCSQRLKNVLVDPPSVVNNDVNALKLINAGINGRHAAKLHLALKMWHLFGDISDSEAKYYFQAPNAVLMRNRFTRAFQFRSMASQLNLYSPSKTERPKKELLQRQMLARAREISTYIGKLGEIMMKSRDTSSAQYQAASTLMERIRENDHILTSHNFFYRCNLSSDGPYREFSSKRKHMASFFSDVQAGLVSAKAIPSSLFFVSSNRVEAFRGVHAIHVDITPDVLNEPPASVGIKRLGECIFEKMKTKAGDILGKDGRFHNALVEVHVHCDVHAFMPLPTLIARDAELSNVTGRVGPIFEGVDLDNQYEESEQAGVDPTNAEEPEEPRRFDEQLEANTIFRGSWMGLLADRGDFEYVKSLHAVLFARALCEILDSRKRAVDIFIHGASISTLGAEWDISIRNAAIGRHVDTVLLSPLNADTSHNNEIQEIRAPVEQKPSQRGTRSVSFNDIASRHVNSNTSSNSWNIEEGSIDVFDPSCCWKLEKSVISRFALGDSQHGQSQTRFVRSLLSISTRKFPERLSGELWKVLLVCNRQESPVISSKFPELRPFSVIQQVQERFVDINKFSSAVERFNLNQRDLALVFALSGCAECPSTRRVKQSSYVKALFTLKGVHPDLCISAIQREESFQWLEVITCLAYLSERRKVDNIQLHRLGGLRNDPKSWCNNVRKSVCQDKKSCTCPSLLLPESTDLQLQFSRAYAAVEYWDSSREARCSREDLICEFSSGYLTTGLPLHETEEDIARRQKLLKCLVRTCSCASGCKPSDGIRQSRCGCRRQNPPSFCFFCKCHPSCQNKGLDDETTGPEGNNGDSRENVVAIDQAEEPLAKEQSVPVLEMPDDVEDTESEEDPMENESSFI